MKPICPKETYTHHLKHLCECRGWRNYIFQNLPQREWWNCVEGPLWRVPFGVRQNLLKAKITGGFICWESCRNLRAELTFSELQRTGQGWPPGGPLATWGLSFPSVSNFEQIFHKSGLLRGFQVVISPFVAKKTEWEVSRAHVPAPNLKRHQIINVPKWPNYLSRPLTT